MREEIMKKQFIILFTLVAISVISFTACEPFIENKITVQNQAAGDVRFVIAGKTYDVASNSSLVLPDFKKGTFAYSTVYRIPVGYPKVTEEGDLAGNMVFNAGTEILLQYISNTTDSSYTIIGILTSSDDVNRPDPFDDETP
jgi:hypothetical protein